MTSPVTPDEPESARSEDREAAPRTEAGRAFLDVPLYDGGHLYGSTRAEFAATIIAIETEARGDLSTAWEAAEAALPEGSDDEDGDWLLTLTRTDDGETRGRYVATAGPYFGAERDAIAAFGPTPAAALTALTARLQARSTEPKP